MTNNKIICNKCGKDLNEFDINDNNYSFKFDFGYGSKNDGDVVNFNLCLNCLDSSLEELFKTFKYVPDGWRMSESLFLTKEQYQKVFECWKETSEWYDFMFCTYEELKDLNGFILTDILNNTIKKFHPEKPLLESIL